MVHTANRPGHGIRAARRLLLATALGSSTFVGVGLVLAPHASALTIQDKSAFYSGCRADGGTVQDCCHLIGGQYEAIYDENGNLIAETCTYSSDPSRTLQQGPGLSNSNVQYVKPSTGAVTSGASSGGVSKAGMYGLQQIVEPVTSPPPNTIP